MNKGTLSPNRISLKCKKNKILFLLKIQQSYFQKSSYNMHLMEFNTKKKIKFHARFIFQKRVKIKQNYLFLCLSKIRRD